MKRPVRGFSLIEVVLTLALLGLLASMAAPLAETLVRRNKEQQLREALYQVRDAIDAYKRAFDAGYIEKRLNASGYPPSLQVLVDGVRDVRSAKGAKFYFLRRIPRDPLRPAKEDDQGGWGLRSYDSQPDNPRDGEDVFDVYSKAPGKGLDGTPYGQW
ncbi:prepilin-type N-terminal cleavage/methylation domain-containing protein [Pseudomonas sp. NPDC089554]|uniref:prepilin-type N-terminal cleavage/methylation domain-containing protein n=1 Tax=Pseudomonas sp. NPDC089554 TaxID=3390653 RepID=UPI003CFC64DF